MGQVRVKTDGFIGRRGSSVAGYQDFEFGRSLSSSYNPSSISRSKLRPADDTPAKIKVRLAAELAKAKTDRETGKQISRGGKTKAGR